MTSPIYVAIDTPDMGRARTIAEAVKRHAGGLKLGLEFFCHNGRTGVMELAAALGERGVAARGLRVGVDVVADAQQQGALQVEGNGVVGCHGREAGASGRW